jgi:amino acid permease
MTAACAGIGMAIPFFDDIMALLGAALMSFLVFVFPPLFRLKLSHSSMGIPHKVFCILVIVFGVLVAVVGTIEAVTGLSEHMK